jgi:hypothetical protein
MKQNHEQRAREVFRDLMKAFRNTLPAKQFAAEMVLATVHMGLLACRIESSTDQIECRKTMREFKQAEQIIRKGIDLLCEQSNKSNSQITVRAASTSFTGRSASA